ncbi:DUF6177 family protein [Cellulomonas sp. NPDC089187]|uniref:DUF6177 family protein n=1 Tax=Cellulomonas sp. NPDC089187 TaxID=3154970 RepID=UPI0034417321
MQIVHPVADEWTEEYALYASSTERVLLTAPLATFLEAAVTDGLKPVLLTEAKASLSPFVAAAMRRSGGYWLVRDPSGVYDGLSGYRTDRVEDLWRRSGTDRPRLPGYQWDPERVSGRYGVLLFDVHAHTRAEADVSVGPLAETVLTGLGGDLPQLWGPAEPLLAPWDPAAVTAAVRERMPVSPVLHAWRPGSYLDLDVARTRTGLLHHVKGGVTHGLYPRRLDRVLATATRALTDVADQHQPTIAFVSLSEMDAGLYTRPTGSFPEVPLAVLIGPRGVHDLGLDIDALSADHDLTVLGRSRTPSLLVRFSRPDVGLWAQLLAFAHDIGPQKIATAVGMDG